MNHVLMQGTVIAVIGICIVFLVLAIVWGILELLRIFFTAKKEPVMATPTVASPVTTPAPSVTTEDSEIIAVLTAAIAASLNQPASSLRIRSYRRVDAATPIWNRTARRDNLIV
ncbi:MAG: hypothetical protein E7393_02190 [Ruminococcaceae bacterium]|nr:hypothetical protein [Oscillospiraceae bacterium]